MHSLRPCGIDGIELVSPIYTATATSSTTSSNPSWATDLAVLFSALHKHFHLAPSPSCATHIHVSRVPPLSGNELAALAKAALYFEPAVDRLVPPFRRGGGGDSGIGGGGGETRYWCRSNRASAALMALSLAGCLARLDDQLDSFENEAAAAVAETMNLVSRDSPVGRAKGKTADFVHGKLFKWNFAGVLPGGSGTVEFRQPAGCLAAGDAAAWVRFKLAFVAGAVRWGPGLGRDGVLWPEAGESLEELWGMLDTGRRELRWERLEGVEALFQGAQESVSLC